VTDIFELQDQITASVVGALDVELKTAEIKRQKQHPTDNLTAYDHFLRGLSAFYEHTAESTCEALRQFYKVIDLDPTCATAYGYAATTLIIRRTQGWLSDRDLPEAANECLRLTGEAASRGFDDAEALSLAALVQVCLGFEVAASVELAERSLVLNPNSAWGWYAAGLAKISLGDFDGALEFVGRSIRLNPRDPSGYAHHTSYGLAQFLSNNFVEAIKASEKALVINSSCLPALRIKAASLAMLNRQTEAKTVLDKVKLLHPEVNASIVTKTMIPLRQEDLKFYADALRKAGMS